MTTKDYKNWTKEQLVDEVLRLRKRKKYGLVWEDKPEDVVEQCKTELPVLKEVKNMAIVKDKNGPVNILIEGDNYHALSVLNYTHKGKIDVIYIDPPYNTGNKDFRFNDKYVDREDAYRHSKWVSFMEKRLRLARTLLGKDGVIFISIGDDEIAQLKLLCGEIFGEKNVEQMIWDKVSDASLAGSGKMKITKRYRLDHEYIIVAYKNKDTVVFNKPNDEMILKNEYGNADNDLRGDWVSSEICKSETKSNPKGKNFYEIIRPAGLSLKRQWHFDRHTFDELDRDKRIYWGNGQIIPRLKKFILEGKNITPSSILNRHGSTTTGNKEIEAMGLSFDNPKSLSLIKWLIQISAKQNSTIVDFMAGSGTAGHANHALNKEDGCNRQFILCTNNENDIATDVCYPRVVKVISGYKKYGNGERVIGLGGNLKYFRTAFVNAEPNDKNKEALTKQATEMLSMREDTFETVKETGTIKIFKSPKQHTGIVFDEDAIPALKKEIAKIGGVWSVYIFSLGDDTFEDEFEDMKQKITVAPIPEAILRVYRRLFKP